MRTVRALRWLSCVGLAMALAVCKPTDTAQPAATPSDASPSGSGTDDGSIVGDEQFRARAGEILDGYLEREPSQAVELGLHAYDGRLPEITPDALAKQETWLRERIAELEPIDERSLSRVARVERAALLTALRDRWFRLAELNAPKRNPMFYMGALDLTPYISRDYAPLPERAAAVTRIAEATPAFLKQAQDNLDPSLPRTFVQTALLQSRGLATFVRTDVPAAMKELGKPERTKLDAATTSMAKAIDGYSAFLEKRLTAANDDFALGAERFEKMLALTQGIDVDLPRMQEVLETDLKRNLEAMKGAAKRIDPEAPVADVVARVSAEKPKLSRVLDTASTQSAAMRRFLVANEIVTIPTEDVAEVVETPPFMRWNAAFLSSAGVFEEKALPSFYYISPPDPAWPPAKQKAYVPDRHDLLFITIHEVWPGHFLHGLHLKVSDSRILKSLWNYTTGEGWAHYTEEMMWEQGVSEDPKVHVGQLKNALLRNVRALSALGLHTSGMTVAQSKQRFMDEAFQDEANAEQQAVRGTFDPMYLAYTTGKLVILKLRADLQAKQGDAFSLRAFHDELLGHGAAPLSAIRASMLGPDAAQSPPL